MGRRKKGEIVNGWVCLDKPFGMGSTEAVSKVRRLFDAQKAGHAGTLDPLASGILPTIVTHNLNHSCPKQRWALPEAGCRACCGPCGRSRDRCAI